MQFTNKSRLLAVVLAILMLIVPAGFSVNAAPSSGTELTNQTLAELLNTSKYSEYFDKYGAGVRGDQSYVLTSEDILKWDEALTGLTSSNYDTEEEYKAANDAFKASIVSKTFTDANGVTLTGLYLPNDGTVGWTLPFSMKEGLYAVKFVYYAVYEDGISKSTPIERTFLINGKVPFQEARFLEFAKTWTDDTKTYQKDADGNIIYKYMDDKGDEVYPYVSVNKEVLEFSTKTGELKFNKTGKTLTDKDVEGLQMYPVFTNDINENETKPSKIQSPEWDVCVATDSNGYYDTAFEFYFPEGVNTIQLQCQREAMVVSSIELYPYENLMSYKEYIEYYESQSYGDVKDAYYKIQAEYPTQTSENTVYANADRTSWISEPQDASAQVLNSIGGDGGSKWNTVGQWVRYTIDVEESGFYNIVLRFRQSQLEGTFSSRALRVATASMLAEGKGAEVPFDEAYNCQFNYDSAWQVNALNDGTTTFRIFLEKGTNEIELVATLGNMASILKEVEQSMTTINSIYIKLLMITGASPDVNRDYGFYRIMPEDIDELLVQANKLRELTKNFEEMVGSTGSHAKTLEKVAQLLERMGSAEDKIAANMDNLKENLGTLGTWLNTSVSSPLQIDYIVVQSVGAKLPQDNDNFFQTLWFEIQMFINSWIVDYNTIGSTTVIDEDDCIEVWTSLGRDQAIIIRNLINSDFAQRYPDTVIKLKLVAGGSLLPSVLAGVGPDISLQHGAGDVINWAIRGALEPLNQFNDPNAGYEYTFEQALGTYNPETDLYEGGWFVPAAIEDMTLYALYEDGTRTQNVYAIPETLGFSMMFYRADILSQLGIPVPKTWTDVVAMISTLMENNMQVALPTSRGGTDLLIYQMGGNVYADDGRRVDYDSDTSLTAFDMLCKFFTDYSQPISYSFANRFRTGEIPVGIVGYGEYTQLSVYATEIKGMWEFTPLPGIVTYNDDGTLTINNTSVAGAAGSVLVNDEKRSKEDDNKCWQFLSWFSSANAQTNYANELTALLGNESKHSTANVQALKELPWTTQEYKNLMAQFNNLIATREYPGGYIISRYVDFAFMAAYNKGANPTEALLGYIDNINAEITRKRQEFNLAYFDSTSGFTS